MRFCESTIRFVVLLINAYRLDENLMESEGFLRGHYSTTDTPQSYTSIPCIYASIRNVS
jgi:hypothetical protein